ncbi:MAG TPA: L,D-transpeptidase [Coxiellaceae bacterium]|nr:L,D-transpeptidase [Coxiellaceae bacterium]
MKKHFLNLIFWVFLISPFSAILADDTGAETIPSVIAADEQAASQHNYGRTLCNNPNYFCRPVGKNDHWYSLFPNYLQRQEVMRLNRTNVALMYRNWLVVPKDFNKTTYMDMSPLPKHIDTHGQKEVYVNLSLFAFGAYDKTGKLIYWGPVSSGRKKCFDTNGICSTATGNFRVFRMEGKNCISHEFPMETHGGYPMPYCMYFHNGTALHYSTLSGFINRSDGCVRMFKADAQWLNKKFVKLGTLVVVTK